MKSSGIVCFWHGPLVTGRFAPTTLMLGNWAAAPPLAPASVSINTSVLYVGQAVGSAIGGMFFARDLAHDVRYASVGLAALALTMVLLRRPRSRFLA